MKGKTLIKIFLFSLSISPFVSFGKTQEYTIKTQKRNYEIRELQDYFTTARADGTFVDYKEMNN